VLRAATAGAEVIERTEADGMVSWHVRAAGPGARDRIVARLCEAGIGVAEVSEIGTDLEETFLAVTSRKAVQ
jgi:hypothetical protein